MTETPGISAEHAMVDSEARGRVTVVIPAYNAERTIGRCIASVLADGYPALEIIVVDDGSTDATAAVVAGFTREHAATIRMLSRSNGGACAARNAGLLAASGEFVQFLDSDDEICNGKIGKSVEHFAKDDALVCVYTDLTQVIDGADVRLFQADHVSISRLANRGSGLFSCNLNTDLPLWRRSFLTANDLTWNEALSCWQEAVFNVEALTTMESSKQIAHLPGPYVRFHRSTTHAGISGSFWSAKYILGQMTAIELMVNTCESRGMAPLPLRRQAERFAKKLLAKAIVGNSASAWSRVSAAVLASESAWYWRLLASLPFSWARLGYRVYRLVFRNRAAGPIPGAAG